VQHTLLTLLAPLALSDRTGDQRPAEIHEPEEKRDRETEAGKKEWQTRARQPESSPSAGGVLIINNKVVLDVGRAGAGEELLRSCDPQFRLGVSE